MSMVFPLGKDIKTHITGTLVDGSSLNVDISLAEGERRWLFAVQAQNGDGTNRNIVILILRNNTERLRIIEKDTPSLGFCTKILESWILLSYGDTIRFHFGSASGGGGGTAHCNLLSMGVYV